MATIDPAPGEDVHFGFDPGTQQIVFEETLTEINCYLYGLGDIIPVQEDSGARQAAREYAAHILKARHAIVFAVGDTTIYLNAI